MTIIHVAQVVLAVLAIPFGFSGLFLVRAAAVRPAPSEYEEGVTGAAFVVGFVLFAVALFLLSLAINLKA